MLISIGDWIIIQRQKYTKLLKLKEHATVVLGNFTVELDNIIGQKYFESFQMKLKADNKKLYTLEKTVLVKNDLSIEKSGVDNRNISADNSSQLLSKEEIDEIRESSNSSKEILESLVANSKTFNSKTEYSQEKYLKKKEKKYCDFITVRRPTIRLIMQTYYRLDKVKLQGLRVDDLSQILTYSSVQAEGNYVLYDSGTCGLLTAAILDRIGVNTTGKLIYMHPGNHCQKNAVLAMNYPEELLNRCINVNIYSVLRWFYQEKEEDLSVDNKIESVNNEDVEVVSKKRKLLVDKANDDEVDVKKMKTPQWHEDNKQACKILKEKVDAIIVVSKEHPVGILKGLLPFLNLSRNIVVYNVFKEPLMDLYYHLKNNCGFVNVQIVDNFMRYYQVLPDRTHPEMNTDFGGCLLYGTKVE